MKRSTYYITQDGADFYAYDKPGDEKPFMVRTSPFPVPDFDIDAAVKARQWFAIRMTGHDLVWEDKP